MRDWGYFGHDFVLTSGRALSRFVMDAACWGGLWVTHGWWDGARDACGERREDIERAAAGERTPAATAAKGVTCCHVWHAGSIWRLAIGS